MRSVIWLRTTTVPAQGAAIQIITTAGLPQFQIKIIWPVLRTPSESISTTPSRPSSRPSYWPSMPLSVVCPLSRTPTALTCPTAPQPRPSLSTTGRRPLATVTGSSIAKSCFQIQINSSQLISSSSSRIPINSKISSLSNHSSRPSTLNLSSRHPRPSAPSPRTLPIIAAAARPRPGKHLVAGLARLRELRPWTTALMRRLCRPLFRSWVIQSKR